MPVDVTPAPDFEAKLCPPERLPARLASMPRPLVFTNGVFDILHRGHVTYLAQARALGASLIVALNTDASVKRLGKGEDRPVNPLEDRAAVMAALQCVDLVTWFDADTPLELILAAGRTCWSRAATGRSITSSARRRCASWGGSVHSIPFAFERSTTSTLSRIRGS